MRSLLFVLFGVAIGVLIGVLINSVHSPMVLIGPVDIKAGIVGVVSQGVSRDQVIQLLGKPLRERDTIGESPGNRYPEGSSPLLTDYFEGVYADVSWFSDDRACGLAFDLDRHARECGRELHILLRNGSKQMVVSRGFALADARKPSFWHRLGLQQSQVRLREQSVYLDCGEGTGAVLDFSDADGHLYAVFVFWAP